MKVPSLTALNLQAKEAGDTGTGGELDKTANSPRPSDKRGIYNQLGQQVINQTLSGAASSFTIRTNQLQDGVYNYRFTMHEQIIKRDKFVVVR